jgi:hypothetical protein
MARLGYVNVAAADRELCRRSDADSTLTPVPLLMPSTAPGSGITLLGEGLLPMAVAF